MTNWNSSFKRLCNYITFSCHSSCRGNDLHQAVDLVCEDYGIVNAPFSGSLAGPVSRKDPAGNQFDGVKLLNDGKKGMTLVEYLKGSVARERNFWLLIIV